MDGTTHRAVLAVLSTVLILAVVPTLASAGPEHASDRARDVAQGRPFQEQREQTPPQPPAVVAPAPAPPPAPEPLPPPPASEPVPATEPSGSADPSTGAPVDPAAPGAPDAPGAPAAGPAATWSGAGPASSASASATGPPRPDVRFTVHQRGGVAVADASASTSLYGPILRYLWDWGDGTFTTTTVPRAEHGYTDGWPTYQILLVAVDATGTKGVATRTFAWDAARASSIEPVVEVTVRGLSVRVDASASSSDNVIVRHLWDWGDTSVPSDGPVAAHVYQHAGRYTILLEVIDALGGHGYELVTVDVHDTAALVRAPALYGGTTADSAGVAEVLLGTRGARWLEESPAPDLLPLLLVALAAAVAVRRR